jgi:hypothetical protein
MDTLRRAFPDDSEIALVRATAFTAAKHYGTAGLGSERQTQISSLAALAWQFLYDPEIQGLAASFQLTYADQRAPILRDSERESKKAR